MIVFQNINHISVFPALLLGIVFDVYYLSSSAGLHRSNFFQRHKSKLPFQLLPLANARSLEEVRYFDYGIESIVYGRVDQLLPLKLIKELGNVFNGIVKLDEKLKLTLASYLSYSDIGKVTLFLRSARQYRRIYFLHTSFQSYAHYSCNIPDFVSLHHFYFPADDLAGLLIKIVSKIFRQVRRGIAPQKTQSAPSSHDNVQQHYFLETAVVFHQSVSYGKMFKKLQYFSACNRSRLHQSNVLNLVLDRQKTMTDTVTSNDDFIMHDFRRISNWQIILMSIKFFFSKIVDVSSLDELLGVIFLTRMYYGIRSWKVALLQYPNLKNVIIDYDILFPKSLALALESKGIRTIAMQERGSLSFASIYSIIADTYLFCGGLFTEYGKRNSSIVYRRAVDFGAWRTTFLLGAEVPPFESLSMQKNGMRDVLEFNSVITVLGWFTAEQNSASHPFINMLANLDLHNHVKSLASTFPDSAVVLRLKILTELDQRMLLKSFSGWQNIFICDEYLKLNASYALCKRADVIVSAQTSLADECLAAGKKVVVLDSTHNLKNICTDIYPEEFHFTFATDSQKMLDLVSRCLNKDAELMARYDKLKEQLSGKYDLSTPDIIPNSLEQFLL
jgi:hypothetical protein